MHLIRTLTFLLLPLFALSFSAPAQDTIWALEAVDATGEGTHPKVGAFPSSENKVTLQGIALNRSDEYLDPASMWQVYIQAEAPDSGGIAAWAGIFYNSTWPRYPEDIEPGDRIEISGFVSNHNGKVNFNERHSAAPEMLYTVTILDRGVGMPTPIEISDLSTCNTFDPLRATGGELYQAQWVQFKDVEIVSGTWGAGNSVVVADILGATMSLLLSGQGDFDSFSAPVGRFNPVGIFDQEDTTAPYHDDYRLWVKKYDDLGVPSAVSDWESYR